MGACYNIVRNRFYKWQQPEISITCMHQTFAIDCVNRRYKQIVRKIFLKINANMLNIFVNSLWIFENICIDALKNISMVLRSYFPCIVDKPRTKSLDNTVICINSEAG